jgi:hypothetical protein
MKYGLDSLFPRMDETSASNTKEMLRSNQMISESSYKQKRVSLSELTAVMNFGSVSLMVFNNKSENGKMPNKLETLWIDHSPLRFINETRNIYLNRLFNKPEFIRTILQ